MATLNEVRDKATAALAAGEYGKALSLAQLMQRHVPRDFQIKQLLGKIYLETRQTQQALDAFHAVLDVEPEDVVSWSALAMIAEEEGDLEGALEHFERAFEVDPGNREVAAEIARLHSTMKHPKASEPGSSVHSMARRFLIEKKYENAIPWLQEALRVDPGSTEIAVGLARALWLAWRAREAEQVARLILVEHPDCLRALAVVAGAAYSRGGDETLRYLARTAELNPGNSVARALFVEAGLVFPARDEWLNIPDAEVAAALAATTGAQETLVEPQVVLPAGDAMGPAQAGSSGAGAEPEPRSEGELVPSVGSLSPDAAEEPEGEPEAVNPLLRRLAATLREAPSGDDEGMSPGSEATGVRPKLGARPQMMIGAMEAAAHLEPPDLPEEPAADPAVDEAEPPQSAADHIAAAAGFADQGMIDLAVSEYKAALKRDASSAQEVSEAVMALAEAHPDNPKARWLAGDALATDGQFRRAVEQYMKVLKKE